MTTRAFRTIVLLIAALVVLRPASGQVERLTLEQMVRRTDNAVFAEVTEKSVFRATDPRDGSVNYYTRLTLEGRSMRTGRDTSVDVLYLGGFINEREGVWNSEAPAESDTEVGRRVVVFYKWLDDCGGGVPGNFVYSLHGGLYRTVVGPKGRVVLGRGSGYPVRMNTSLEDLASAIDVLDRDE